MVISPDDFNVGDIVTVVKGQECGGGVSGIGLFGLATETKTVEDNSWKGDLLEIKAISLPYIAVKNLSDTFFKDNISINTKLTKLGKLTPEYIKAMKNS